jgi:hypothetical protein
MKRITTLGLFCIVLLLLGMKEPSTQTCCSLNCTTSCLMMYLQTPTDDHPKAERDYPRGQGKVRMDRMKPNGEGMNRTMPVNMVEHIMEVAAEIDPELASKLSVMCEKDPDAFDKIVRRQGHRLGSLIRLREQDPELFEVKVTELKTDAEIYHVAESLRGQDLEDPNMKAKLVELEGLVRVKTAISIRSQMLSIERLERHIEALRTRIEDTSLRFDEIVIKRLDQLLNAVGDESANQPPQTD